MREGKTALQQVREFCYALRQMPGWPNIDANAPTLIYDLLSRLGFREQVLYDLLGARGYLRAVRYQTYEPSEEAKSLFDQALQETLNKEEDDEPQG